MMKKYCWKFSSVLMRSSRSRAPLNAQLAALRQHKHIFEPCLANSRNGLRRRFKGCGVWQKTRKHLRQETPGGGLGNSSVACGGGRLLRSCLIDSTLTRSCSERDRSVASALAALAWKRLVELAALAASSSSSSRSQLRTLDVPVAMSGKLGPGRA